MKNCKLYEEFDFLLDTLHLIPVIKWTFNAISKPSPSYPSETMIMNGL